MKHLARLILTLLLVAGAYGQIPSNMTGIKIKESSFDPQTRTVTLAFINDSVSDITAWAYCVRTQNAAVGKPEHGYCTTIDPLSVVIDYKIEAQKRPRLLEPDCPMCRLIHPGQQHVLSFAYPQFTEIVSAKIEIVLVAYSDGSVEVAPEQEGNTAVGELTARRQQELEVSQTVLGMGQRILADSGNPHPAAAMIEQLKTAGDSRLAGITESFKKPEKHQGNDREFIPNAEREYLTGFVAEQQVRAAMYSRHQIKAVSK